MINIDNIQMKKCKIAYETDHISISDDTKPKVSLALTFSPFQIIQLPKKNRLSYDLYADAVLGIKMIKNAPFLLLVTQSHAVASIYLSTIYEIREIKWLPITPQNLIEETLQEFTDHFTEINKIFARGNHYFSYDYNLHHPFTLNMKSDEKYHKFYEQFIWNYGLRTLNSSSSNLAKWCIPIIQGYAQSFSMCFTKNQEIIVVCLISRRSHKKTGTRYYSRGIDQKGNVANFTETQQILIFKNHVFSHLQIRGSVPAFFQQTGINIMGELTITRNQSTTKRAFQQHFTKLLDIYGDIMCVNLLSKKKADQYKLIKFYQSLIERTELKKIDYTFFDFHEECKNNKFENTANLLTQLRSFISCHGFNVIDLSKNQILNRQNGVLRVNCLDCLDRTNYVQSRVGLEILEKQIYNFGGPQLQLFNESSWKLQTNFQEIIPKFNEIWADNGDAISYQYTGIGSTHTDITKKGKRTISGSITHKVKSVMRFFNQFSDHKKHEAITDLVSSESLRSHIKMKKSQSNFLEVLTMSYNIAKHEQIQNQINLDYSFTEEYIKEKKPEIIIIFGFTKKQSKWLNEIFNKQKSPELESFIEDKKFHIKALGYDNFTENVTESSCILFFATHSITETLYEIQHETINNYNSNDQILVGKFNVFHTSLVFSGANCSSFDNFKKLTEKTHNQAFQGMKLGKTKSSKIIEHHYRMIFGNIGIKSSYKPVKNDQQVNKFDDIKNCLQDDELQKERHNKQSILRNYMEGPISFYPNNNRIMFWNKDDYIIKIWQYKEETQQRCVYGFYSYEVNKKKD